MEIRKKKTEELFGFFDSIAPSCPKCGKKYCCISVRYGALVIGIYSCDCQEGARNLLIYRGIVPEQWEKVKEIIGKSDLEELRKQEGAATAAKIICPKCRKPRRYIESVIMPDGSVQHRFDCRNGFCPDFEKTIWTKLTNEDCERIFAAAKEEAKCKICKKTDGTKIHCPKEKGIVCEEHCVKCEYHDSTTSKFICRFWK